MVERGIARDPVGLRRSAPWLLLVLLLGACSPHLEIYPKLDSLAGQGKYEQAAKLVEQNREKYDERNVVLYNLDRGLLYHYAGKFEESNKAFEAAERRMDELFTESIARQTGAFLSSDNTLPFRGEDFETVIINVFRALNYIQMGSMDEALVEARKVNQKLEFINSKYPRGKRNVYRQDGFARLLAGILYELGGTRDDVNDAFISNRKAAQIYEGDFSKRYGIGTPDLLKSNLLTTAAFMGREELEAARKSFPREKMLSLAEKRGKAQLFFVHFTGRSPVKVEDAIHAVMPDGYLLRIAFPRYRRRGYSIRGSSITVDGKLATLLEPAEPIGRIAIRNLQDRKGRITVKAIARATTKYLATLAAEKLAEDKGGAAAGLLTRIAGNVAAAVSEQADLRSWQLLPDQILIGRVLVAPGEHSIAAEFHGGSGGAMSRKSLGTVNLRAGESKFFILHTNR